MQKTTRLLLNVTFLFTLISFSGSAQLRTFTEEPQAYFDELTSFFEEMDDVESDSVESKMASFLPVWTDLDEEARPGIYLMSNSFLRKRVTGYQTWKDFLKIIEHFHFNETPETFVAWSSESGEWARRASNRAIVEYIENLSNAFEENIIYEDRKVKWMYMLGEHEFVFEGKPLIKYTNIDLWGYFGKDSTLIETTNGTYDILEKRFIGEGGMVFWTRAGISRDTLYGELQDYKIELDKTYYEADSVQLYSLIYVTEPIYGSFEERMTLEVGTRVISYPQFNSYDRVTVTDFVPGVDYQGGFSVSGNRFYASDNLPRQAVLRFKKEGENFVDVRSERFQLSTSEIRAEAAHVAIALGESDSLYHPKSTMKYDVEQVTLTLTRVKEGLSMTPYIDTYHNLDIYLEQIVWKTTSPQMYLQNLAGGSENNMVFESQEYYRQERFDALTGLSRTNPLYDLRRVALARDTVDQQLETVATMMRMDQMNAERFLLNMSIQGFVNYDPNTKTVSFNDKLFDYILNSENKRDYDVIRFISQVGRGANAKISLLNNDMEIVGINAIAVSDSQEVALFPAERKITVHEGMDFDFAGRIQAGRFNYWGQNHFFDYDMFRISMPDIDSMRFAVEEFDDGTRMPGTRPKLVGVKNTLQDINGELLIDKPNNKSGKIQYHDYPIFKSGTGSYVYYDRPSIYGGVYEREDFFVELEPFEIDSLDNTSTEGLKFAGVFVSAGIFPDMPQQVMVQEDYSLGFKTSTPQEGLPAYGGKGRFFSDLQLSNDGLVGTGTVTYLTSTAVGQEFVFFPDSTNGMADTYVAEERLGAVNTPPAASEDVFINWRPYQDVMYATSTSTPFRMYQSDVSMVAIGTLAYGAGDMRGDAVLDFLNAQTKSKDYVFYNRSFEAGSMNFKVKANPESEWAFKMRDARGNVDFNQMDGDFTLNQGEAFMEFSINEYITWMDHADWDITAKTIDVNHVNGELSPMVSIHNRQDSLFFDAKSAKFALEPSLLEAFEVPHMDVADSRIFPDSGYVAIDPGADMRKLTEASLTANRFLKYHNFYNGNFKVRGRFDYGGNAEYEYLDEDGTAWPLYFEQIKVDTGGTTIGYANVAKEDGFYLSSFFGYYGEVNLRASNRLLNYDGYLMIQHACDNLETNWFSFESEIDPKNIVIDLPEDNPRTRTDDVFNGIYLSPDSTSIYTGFLNSDASRVDKEIISATGVLFYDKDLSSYVITTRKRLQDENEPANYVAFNNRDCVMIGKGKITLNDDLGRVTLDAYGTAEHDLRNDELTMDITAAYDFFFSEELMEAIAAEMNAESLPGVKLDREAYRIGMNYQFEDEEDKQEYFEEVQNFGAPEKVPDELEKTIYFTELTLIWDEEKVSFVSDGDIGIGHIGEVQVNKKVDGIFELRQRRRRYEVYLYLEPGNDYYYFQYQRNNMQFFTSKREVLDILLQVENDDRGLERDDNLPSYVYSQTSRGRVNLFLRRHEE